MTIEYPIYRKTTHQVRNPWNRVLFEAGVVVKVVYDLGRWWWALPINAEQPPRMLPKNECRLLSEEEKRALGVVK